MTPDIEHNRIFFHPSTQWNEEFFNDNTVREVYAPDKVLTKSVSDQYESVVRNTSASSAKTGNAQV